MLNMRLEHTNGGQRTHWNLLRVFNESTLYSLARDPSQSDRFLCCLSKRIFLVHAAEIQGVRVCMHFVFCTLFDRNYLCKGLALFESLRAHCLEFTLWILCMDDATYSILERMGLENVRLISLRDFEDDALREAKRNRTSAEYCWTCTAPLVLFVIQNEPTADLVAYVDADVFFYSSPQPIYDELSGGSTLIVGHRFSSQYQALEETSGIYNVSMVVFRRDRDGLQCLTWWKERVIEACRLDPEAGLCGDQKYLDDWPTRFRNVVVLQHKGGGLAPWNISNYRLSRKNGDIYVDSDQLVFYHFHSLQILEKRFLTKRAFLASRGYRFTKEQLALVYEPYARELERAIKKVKELVPEFISGDPSLKLLDILRAYRNGNLLLV